MRHHAAHRRWREFVPYVMLFVMFAGITFFVVGLIKPSLAGGSRKNAVLFGIALFMGGFFGLAVTVPKPDPVAAAPAPRADAVAQGTQPQASPPSTQPEPQAAAAPAPQRPPAPPPLPPRVTNRVANPDAEMVFIWRDTAALREASRLINAGVHRTQPQLMMPLIACIVPNNTSVVQVDPGIFSSTVLVTSGQNVGCRGIAETEMFPR